jgi:Tol biopolymer transport system component/DNA-binding winged helix-turn-helix (wHTH) protein
MTIQRVCFEFDDVRVDVANARAWKAQKTLAIEPKAFRLLLYLLENRARLVEKDELLSAVWPDTFVTENALTRAIAHLRKALGDSKNGAKYIETAPTRGYRFVATVNVVEAPQPGGDQISQPAGAGIAPISTQVGSSRRLARFAIPSVLLIAAAAAALWLALPKRARSTHVPAPARMQATSSPGMDIFASFSPDSSTIAYSSDVNGKLEIYLKQLTRGGNLVQLTNDGGPNLQPAWSPDGKTIAFHSAQNGGIWLIPALGGTVRQLTTFGSGPSWSPDGSEIAFQSGAIRDLSATADVSIAASTIWIVSVHDGSTRQVTPLTKPAGAHNNPAWSPSGKSIAFTVADFGADAGLWTIDTDGTGLTRLVRNGSLYNPVYSRDSRSIYVASLAYKDFAIWKIPSSGSESEIKDQAEKIVSTFPAIPRYLAVSPDGRSLAYSDVNTMSELYAVPLNPKRGDEATGTPVALTQDTRFRKAVPQFSPDGKRILFDVGSVSFESGVWVMDADGKNATQINSGCSSPTWLPGGDAFLCWSYDGERSGPILLKYRLDTKRSEVVRPLEATAPFLSASPDGKSIVFMSFEKGPPNLWTASVEAKDARQLTFDAELAGFPAFSPDGKRIAFEQKRGDTTNVMVMPSAGGPATQLTDEPGQSWPHGWSPDGKRIAFAGLRGGVWNIWSVSTDSRQEKKITSYTQMNHYVRYPSWSPDGTRIVYEYGQTKANVWIVSFN